MQIEIAGLPAFEDNYFWLIIEKTSGQVLAIDPGDAKVIEHFLNQRSLKLTAILCTHHHADHIGGNIELQQKYNCPIYGNGDDQGRIPGLTHKVREGEPLELGPLKAQILFVPGHTSGHIAYYFEDLASLFVGDCLFAMGCGRLFEGSPEQMHQSLQKIAKLPDSTRIFCAHEYTLKNCEFATPFMDHRPAFRDRARKVEEQRKLNQPTVPFLLSDELETNPFMNVRDHRLKKLLNLENGSEAEVFGQLRALRNNF